MRKQFLAAVGLAALANTPAGAATILQTPAQAFSVFTSFQTGKPTLFDPAYRQAARPIPSPYVVYGTYSGSVIHNSPGVQVLLPGFDSSLGVLTSATVILDSSRAITNGNISGLMFDDPRSNMSMGFTSEASWSATIGGEEITAGSGQTSTSCFFGIYSRFDEKQCIRTRTDRAAVAGELVFDPALFLNGPVAVDINHVQVTSWLGGAFFTRSDFFASTSNTFDWAGTLAVRYTYTPFAAGVPEPESWALLILGFGAVGAAMRWRRARVLPKRAAFA